MLRINRKAGQSIIISVEDIEIVVTVDEICRSEVRMSVQAPRSVIVDRDEIHRKKLMEKV